MPGKKYGGKIKVRLSTGETLSLRGNMSLKTSGRSNEAIVNQDRSLDQVTTLTPYAFDINFADDGADYEAWQKASRFDVTFDEEDNGVTHYYTSCIWVGEPEINRMNGEVTGLSGAAENYNKGS